MDKYTHESVIKVKMYCNVQSLTALKLFLITLSHIVYVHIYIALPKLYNSETKPANPSIV